MRPGAAENPYSMGYYPETPFAPDQSPYRKPPTFSIHHDDFLTTPNPPPFFSPESAYPPQSQLSSFSTLSIQKYELPKDAEMGEVKQYADRPMPTQSPDGKQKTRPLNRPVVGEEFWKLRMEESERRDFMKKQFPPARIRKMMKSTTDKVVRARMTRRSTSRRRRSRSSRARASCSSWT